MGSDDWSEHATLINEFWINTGIDNPFSIHDSSPTGLSALYQKVVADYRKNKRPMTDWVNCSVPTAG